MSAQDTMPAARAIYLGSGVDAAFAMYHAATGGPEATAVVLCPPWGWDDVSSYRSRRVWAEDLAAAGHPTVRIDLPGTGDSGGSAGDPSRLAAAADSVAAAAAWIRAESGCGRVAVIGLGLGGIAAAMAVGSDAAIDDLVLWAVPSRGRGFVRQMRAFAGLQGARYSLTGESEPALLPAGWLEVNGFVLSAETIAELEATALAELPARGLRRALLLDQDGIPADPLVAAHLTAEGVEVTERPGPGWGSMTFHPERPFVPTEVVDTVRAWLAEAVERVVPMRAVSSVPASTTDLELAVDGVGIRETPVMIDGGAGRLFGILSRPLAAPNAPVGGVFLNAGAVRRIGPNRIWVDTARRWAARGVPTLRLDLEGIGDADGDHDRYRDVAEFYVRDELGTQIRQAIDALVVRGHGPRIILAGLCAGGFWALRGAAADERVTAALLLNPGALDWHPELVEARQAARVGRLRQLAWWRRLLGGGVSAEHILETMAAVVRHRARSIATAPGRWIGRLAGGASEAGDGRVESSREILDRLGRTDTTVVMAFSADEPLHAELERDGFLARAHGWPTLRLERLPARDHTLRPIIAQRAASVLLDRELERELGRTSATIAERSA